MDYESLLELVRNRRSTRQFKPDPLPKECINKIIEAARWAPSGYNMQPWEFIVIEEREIKKSVIRLINDVVAPKELEGITKLDIGHAPDLFLSWADAPVFIILVADKRTMFGVPTIIQHIYQMRDQFFISSLASAFIYMHLAATTLGLASCWVSQVAVPQAHLMLKTHLGLPSEFEIYDMMAVGYPAVKPRGKYLRSSAKLVHYGISCKEDFRTDEEVKDFIRRSKTWVEATARRKPDL